MFPLYMHVFFLQIHAKYMTIIMQSRIYIYMNSDVTMHTCLQSWTFSSICDTCNCIVSIYVKSQAGYNATTMTMCFTSGSIYIYIPLYTFNMSLYIVIYLYTMYYIVIFIYTLYTVYTSLYINNIHYFTHQH